MMKRIVNNNDLDYIICCTFSANLFFFFCLFKNKLRLRDIDNTMHINTYLAQAYRVNSFFFLYQNVFTKNIMCCCSHYRLHKQEHDDIMLLKEFRETKSHWPIVLFFFFYSQAQISIISSSMFNH